MGHTYLHNKGDIKKSVSYELSFLSLYQEYHLGEEENQQICFHPLSHRNSVHIKVMTSHQVNWPRDPLQWSHFMDFLKSLQSHGIIQMDI